LLLRPPSRHAATDAFIAAATIINNIYMYPAALLTRPRRVSLGVYACRERNAGDIWLEHAIAQCESELSPLPPQVSSVS
jgi:hypothetical protein